MLANTMDVLKEFPVRKSNRQKQAFRDAVQAYVTDLGYACSVEKGSMGCNNIVIGNPKTAKYLVTAHYDTPAGMLLPNLITPCNPVTFILYQLAVVAVFFIVAIALGVAVGIAANQPEAASLAAIVVYWVMLIAMMAGPANKNNANDNTSGVVTVLETARTMPEMHRDKVCFVLFDLEELGLVGSSAYRKAHRQETEYQVVLNLDCVGDGDHIVMFPTKKAKKDAALMAKLKHVGGWFGQKNISVREKGFAVYPSDQKNFAKGVGIAAFHTCRGVGYYCTRIHTRKDTILEETNVNLLRAAVSTIICGDAVN